MTTTSKTYAALPFEAVKVSLRQNKDGVVVSFVVHPSDLHPAIMTDPVGTRYQLVAVRLGDGVEVAPVKPAEDEQKPGKEASVPPAKAPDPTPLEKAQNNLVASAGIVCRDPRFWDWIIDGHDPTGEKSESFATAWLHHACGVKSRTELRDSTEARAKFFAMREAFEEWKDVVPPF